MVCVASLHGNTQIDGVPQISQFEVNALRMTFAAAATMAICVVYYIALRSRMLSRGPWLSFPEHLWKLSVYRGIVRLMLITAWFGAYFVFMFDYVEGVSSSRMLAMTALGCAATTSCVIEGWSMIGDRDINHIFDFLMPPPDPPPESGLKPVSYTHLTLPTTPYV